MRALALPHLFENEGSHDRAILNFFGHLLRCCDDFGSVWDAQSRHQARLHALYQLVLDRLPDLDSLAMPSWHKARRP